MKKRTLSDGVHCREIILVVLCRVVFRKVELVKIFRKVVKLILGHSMNVLLYFLFFLLENEAKIMIKVLMKASVTCDCNSWQFPMNDKMIKLLKVMFHSVEFSVQFGLLNNIHIVYAKFS